MGEGCRCAHAATHFGLQSLRPVRVLAKNATGRTGQWTATAFLAAVYRRPEMRTRNPLTPVSHRPHSGLAEQRGSPPPVCVKCPPGPPQDRREGKREGYSGRGEGRNIHLQKAHTPTHTHTHTQIASYHQTINEVEPVGKTKNEF